MMERKLLVRLLGTISQYAWAPYHYMPGHHITICLGTISLYANRTGLLKIAREILH